MLYRVMYADGSQELVEGENIRDAREVARELYDQPVKKILVENSDDDEDDNPPDDEDEDDSDDEGGE